LIIVYHNCHHLLLPSSLSGIATIVRHYCHYLSLLSLSHVNCHHRHQFTTVVVTSLLVSAIIIIIIVHHRYYCLSLSSWSVTVIMVCHHRHGLSPSSWSVTVIMLCHRHHGLSQPSLSASSVIFYSQVVYSLSLLCNPSSFIIMSFIVTPSIIFHYHAIHSVLPIIYTITVVVVHTITVVIRGYHHRHCNGR
jgi:hypothetical protein